MIIDSWKPNVSHVVNARRIIEALCVLWPVGKEEQQKVLVNIAETKLNLMWIYQCRAMVEGLEEACVDRFWEAVAAKWPLDEDHTIRIKAYMTCTDSPKKNMERLTIYVQQPRNVERIVLNINTSALLP